MDGEYAAFGKVIRGMDVVRSIARVKTTTRSGMENWPVTPQVITSITIRNR
ncbi:MAG: peptidylprolyl isomerase [Thermoplasmatota archaeon]